MLGASYSYMFDLELHSVFFRSVVILSRLLMNGYT